MVKHLAILIGDEKACCVKNRGAYVSPEVVSVCSCRAVCINFKLITVAAREYLVGMETGLADQLRLTFVVVKCPLNINVVRVPCVLPLLPALKTENDGQKYKTQHKQGRVRPVRGG